MVPQKLYRINHQIQATTVRLLAADGKQIGIFPIEEARTKAAESNQDLVEIASTADPPVVKIINFKKFKYQEAKKERGSVKKTKKVDLKEIRLSPFMADNDLKIKADRAREFLEEGHKVRLVVRFTGRQLSRQQFGYETLKKATTILKDIHTVDIEPRFIGRQIITVITPIKAGV